MRKAPAGTLLRTGRKRSTVFFFPKVKRHISKTHETTQEAARSPGTPSRPQAEEKNKRKKNRDAFRGADIRTERNFLSHRRGFNPRQTFPGFRKPLQARKTAESIASPDGKSFARLGGYPVRNRSVGVGRKPRRPGKPGRSSFKFFPGAGEGTGSFKNKKDSRHSFGVFSPHNMHRKIIPAPATRIPTGGGKGAARLVSPIYLSPGEGRTFV